MKRILQFCVNFLALCAPLMLFILTLLVSCAPLSSSPTDPNGATLTLEPTASYNVLRFTSGTSDAQNVKFEIAGIGTRVNDPKCKLEGTLIKCDLGSVPVGRPYVLPITGTAIQAKASYARASGAIYEIFLK